MPRCPNLSHLRIYIFSGTFILAVRHHALPCYFTMTVTCMNDDVNVLQVCAFLILSVSVHHQISCRFSSLL